MKKERKKEQKPQKEAEGQEESEEESEVPKALLLTEILLTRRRNAMMKQLKKRILQGLRKAFGWISNKLETVKFPENFIRFQHTAQFYIWQRHGVKYGRFAVKSLEEAKIWVAEEVNLFLYATAQTNGKFQVVLGTKPKRQMEKEKVQKIEDQELGVENWSGMQIQIYFMLWPKDRKPLFKHEVEFFSKLNRQEGEENQELEQDKA